MNFHYFGDDVSTPQAIPAASGYISAPYQPPQTPVDQYYNYFRQVQGLILQSPRSAVAFALFGFVNAHPANTPANRSKLNFLLQQYLQATIQYFPTQSAHLDQLYVSAVRYARANHQNPLPQYWAAALHSPPNA